jgi:hypothetical protein
MESFLKTEEYPTESNDIYASGMSSQASLAEFVIRNKDSKVETENVLWSTNNESNTLADNNIASSSLSDPLPISSENKLEDSSVDIECSACIDINESVLIHALPSASTDESPHLFSASALSPISEFPLEIDNGPSDNNLDNKSISATKNKRASFSLEIEMEHKTGAIHVIECL